MDVFCLFVNEKLSMSQLPQASWQESISKEYIEWNIWNEKEEGSFNIEILYVLRVEMEMESNKKIDGKDYGWDFD